MKKIMVIAAVVIMAGILAYKYSDRASVKPAPVVPVVQTGEEGAQLPPDARKKISDGELETAGICSKNVVSIMEDFGRIWDPAPDKGKKGPIINQEDSARISEMLSSYQACSALAVSDRSKCDSIPYKAGGQGGIIFPREICYYKYDNLALSAFSAGKYKKEEVCSDFMASHKIPDVISSADFCSAVKKGPQHICEGLKGKVPDSLMKECKSVFPVSAESCPKDGDCKEMFSAFDAFSSGKSDKCSSGIREACSAMLNSSEAFCAPLRENLINTYCEIYIRSAKKAEEDARKLEEIEKAKLADKLKQKEYEERKKMDAEKAAQEKVKEKLKRAQEEDNKRIKEMLKKLEGNE